METLSLSLALTTRQTMAVNKETFLQMDQKLCDTACEMFCERLKNSWILTPREVLTKERVDVRDVIPVSSLELDTHFTTEEIRGLLPEEQCKSLYDNLVTQMKQAGSKLMLKKRLFPIVTKCTNEVLQKYARCQKIRNQAELRYVVGDPIMEMLCDTYDLYIHLEERVEANCEHDRPGQASTCYTLRGNDNEVAVVLIEAKMTNPLKFQHTVAQLIGYYTAFNTNEYAPPLLFVLSEMNVHLVVLPFKGTDSRLVVNSIVLPEMKLWRSNGVELDLHVLMLLLLVGQKTAELRPSSTELLDLPTHLGQPIPKRNVSRNVATENQLAADLRKELGSPARPDEEPGRPD